MLKAKYRVLANIIRCKFFFAKIWTKFLPQINHFFLSETLNSINVVIYYKNIIFFKMSKKNSENIIIYYKSDIF